MSMYRVNFGRSLLFSQNNIADFNRKNPLKPNVEKTRKIHMVVREGRTGSVANVATVFGCTGFIGRYVVNMLARAGMQVFVPFRGEERFMAHLKVMGDVGQIVPIKFHLRDHESLQFAMRHSNIVVNLIGRMWETRNFTFEDVHVTGAQTIAKFARRIGVERFIHFSVVNPDPNSPSKWMQSKAKGEAAVLDEFPTATIIRPTVVIGPEDQFFNRIAQMMRFWPITIRYQRTRLFQPVWVGDIAQAVVTALKTTDSIGKIYELGGPKIYTMDELYDLVQHVLRIKNLSTIELSNRTLIRLTPFFWEWHRLPRFTVDTLRDVSDRVISHKHPGFHSLGLAPQEIEEHCLRVVRRYRRPEHYDDPIEEYPKLGVVVSSC